MGAVRHTVDTRARVIREFADCGRVDLACERAGVDRRSHYKWLRKHPEYAVAFEIARVPAAQMLEDVATCRAIDGWTEPVTIAGKREEIKKFDNRLLEFLLMGRNPKVFGRKQEISGPDGKPLLEGLDAVIADYRAKRD